MRIGLSGKMVSGKSLVAKYLVENYGFVELSFAAKVKEIAAMLFPRAKYEKDRWLLMQVSQRLRELDPQVWVRFVLPGIVPGTDIVISDVRYPNEYKILKQLNFMMVRMYISRQQRIAMIKDTYPDMPLVLIDDYTEVALDNFHFDYTINNDKGVPLADVYNQIRQMLVDIVQKRGERAR